MNLQNPTASGARRPPSWLNRAAVRPLPLDIDALLSTAAQEVLWDDDRAVLRVEQAVGVARAVDDPEVLARTLQAAAETLQRARRPDRAFVICLEAQPMLERMDDQWHALQLVLLRGTCYLDVGQHDRAQQLINEATEGFASLGDQLLLGRCHVTMARARGLDNDLQSAVDYAAKAVACLASDFPDTGMRRIWLAGEARWRWLLGRQYAEQGHGAAASEEWARAAGLLPEKFEDVERQDDEGAGMAMLDTSVGIFSALGDMVRARHAMTRFVRAAKLSKRAFDRGLAWMRMAEFHVDRGARARGIACARRAARHLPSSSLEPNRLNAQFLLARLLEEAGDLKGAYEARCEASSIEAKQQKDAITMRAELLTLDLESEQEYRRTAQTLQYAQRLSNVGQMVASVNHELNQPMASIRMLAETSIEMLDVGQLRQADEDIAAMHQLSARLVELTSQLAAFPAQPAVETMASVNIAEAVDEALLVLGRRLAQTHCEIVRERLDVDVQGVSAPLVRVLFNLLNNALDAMQAQPKRRISLLADIEGGMVTLRVTDAGPGLSASVLERLFQPFFSSKAAGRGLGLGLALSRDALRRMHGDLTASNRPSGGAQFCVSLPLASR